MRKGRKSWAEKLAADHGLPKVEPIPPRARKIWGAGTIAIPAPREVDALMKRVGRGKLVTTNELRAAIARRHGATIGCPITTGIFGVIAAHAAEEQVTAGKDRAKVTPWWRTLKVGGKLNPKLPGGGTLQARLLRAEGHRIVAGRGQQPGKVADYAQALAMLA